MGSKISFARETCFDQTNKIIAKQQQNKGTRNVTQLNKANKNWAKNKNKLSFMNKHLKLPLAKRYANKVACLNSCN